MCLGAILGRFFTLIMELLAACLFARERLATGDLVQRLDHFAPVTLLLVVDATSFGALCLAPIAALNFANALCLEIIAIHVSLETIGEIGDLVTDRFWTLFRRLGPNIVVGFDRTIIGLTDKGLHHIATVVLGIEPEVVVVVQLAYHV